MGAGRLEISGHVHKKHVYLCLPFVYLSETRSVPVILIISLPTRLTEMKLAVLPKIARIHTTTLTQFEIWTIYLL